MTAQTKTPVWENAHGFRRSAVIQRILAQITGQHRVSIKAVVAEYTWNGT